MATKRRKPSTALEQLHERQDRVTGDETCVALPLIGLAMRCTRPCARCRALAAEVERLRPEWDRAREEYQRAHSKAPQPPPPEQGGPRVVHGRSSTVARPWRTRHEVDRGHPAPSRVTRVLTPDRRIQARAGPKETRVPLASRAARRRPRSAHPMPPKIATAVARGKSTRGGTRSR
jgi:hypothetical protein